MSSRRVDVGTPPPEDQTWESRAVCFHGFTELPWERGEEVESPEFACLGHECCLGLYPGGCDASAEGNVAVYLYNMSNPGVDIDFFFAARNAAGEEVARCEPDGGMFIYYYDGGHGNNWLGKPDFAKRSTIMEALAGGTFTIEVFMRKSRHRTPGTAPPAPFIPENPLCKNILALFLDAESADVIFEVSSEERRGGNSPKRARTTAATTFHAHRFVVRHMASALADLCTPGGGESIAIPITDVEAGVFRLLLYYGYGGTLTADEVHAHAKGLIDAADKYGLVSLKLEAEAGYVRSHTLTVDNVLDTLLYAQSKNCALLKEAVMDFVVQNRGGIIDKVSFEDVPGSIVKDLLVAMERGTHDSTRSEGSHYNSTRVGTLRKMLDEKGLEVDGSREAMIALLKDNS